jgi:hypothetical protein
MENRPRFERGRFRIAGFMRRAFANFANPIDKEKSPSLTGSES